MSNTQTGSISFESTKGLHSYAKQNYATLSRMQSAETAIEQNATSITSLATMNSTYTDPQGNTVENKAKSYVDLTAQGITQSISETYATKTELSNAASDSEITKSANGERYIVTEDAADLPLLTLDPVYGESIQDGTPTPDAPIYIQAIRGQNLIQLKPGLVASHLVSGNEYMAINVGQSYMDIPSGSKVRVSFDIEIIVNTANPVIQIYNTNNKGPKQISNVSVSIPASVGTTIKQRVIAPIQTITDRSDAVISDNFIEFYTTYNTGNIFSISNLQLEYGITVHDYTPFGCLKIISCRKNLINPNRVAIDGSHAYAYKSTTSNGGNGLLLIPGTYTFSCSDSSFTPDGLYVTSIEGSEDFYKYIYNKKSLSFTLDEEKTLYFECYKATGSGGVPSGLNLQLERNSEATDYENYKEFAAYLDLRGHELHCLDETYRDILHIDANGHVTIEKRTGETTIGDITNMTKYANNVYWGKIADMLGQDNTTGTQHNTHLLLSNKFKHTEGSYQVWGSGSAGQFTRHEVTQYPNYNHGLFFKTETNYNGGPAFQAAFADTQIVYPLDSPYTVDLGYINLPQVTDNSTVYVAAEIQPIINGTWWTKAGESVGQLAQQNKNSQGTLEAPYTEVEWVESNGTQYVYTDWNPPIETWGFDIEFLNKNATTTSVGAWRSDTNINGYGTIFGTRNASNVNNTQLSSYNNGVVRVTGNSNTSNHGFKTDKSKQHMSYIGTTFTKPDNTTMTVNRGTTTANKFYANMTIFACHEGLRRAGTGNLIEPSTTRIYSLKFYENTEVVMDLVGAIRNRDGMTGLYDKVKNHFYPAPNMTYGNTVGVLGESDTIAQTLAKRNISVLVDNRAVSRMWYAKVPDLDKLEDGQQITVTTMANIGSSKPELTDLELYWDETRNNSNAPYNVYLKLELADGSTTEWIPCYYSAGTRLSNHYNSGVPVLLTYREDVFYGASTTSAGTSVMRGFWADPNYVDGNDHNNTISYFAGKTGAVGIWATSLFMEDGVGTYQNICTASDGTVTSNNRTTATTKKANTHGFKVGSNVYYTSTTYAANTNISGSNVVASMLGSLFDSRYSFNTTLTAGSLTAYKPIYLVGEVNSEDGLYYLDTIWWTQTPNDSTKVYVLVGACYDSSTSYCRITLYEDNPWYVYDEDKGKLVALNQTVTTFSDKYNTLIDTVDEHTTKVGTFEAQINGHYAVENSGISAGTAAKAATITPTVNNWTLYSGATVAVKFLTANTATTPTLNINGTGAKTILAHNGATLNVGEYKWAANSVIPFIYNGTNWLMQDSGAMKRLTSAETTIQQTANNVLIKATENDTTAAQGGQHLIESFINVAPSGVTISADKVNIEGATIFTGNGRLSQTSLNNAYDAKGAASTAEQNSKSYTDTNAVSRTQRIYYQSASTTPPATPGTASSNWVLDETGAADKWTLKRMSYSSAKPYIYTCEQKQVVSGTVSYTPVLLDDTTTVIDGGKIITGSVQANAIKADSGTFNTANIPDLSAAKITSGDIAAARIQTNLISAIDAKVSDISALSATLGGFQVDTNSIHTKNVAITSNADNSIALSSADFTRTINGTSRAGLRLAIGDKFGVTGDGAIYASSVDLTGKITATSGTIGGCTISNGVLQVANANITGTISGNKINASEINIGDLSGEIGGRNLFSWPLTGTKWKDEEHELNTYQNRGSFTQFTDSLLFDPLETIGEQYTISFDVKSPNGTTNVTLYNSNGNPSAFYFTSVTVAQNVENSWIHCEYTITNTAYSGTGTANAAYNRRIEIYAPSAIGVLVRKIKVEKGSCATDWTPAPEDVAATATTYITDIDTNKGITIKPSDSSGNDYLQINSTDIKFMRNNVDVMNLTDSSFRIGSASGYHSTVNTSGLHIWSGAESTATNEVANFGSTARVGATNTGHVSITSTGVELYNSSNQKKVSIGTGASYFYGGAGTYPYIEISNSSSGAINIKQSATSYTSITSSGMDIYAPVNSIATNVASFGTTARIGNTNSSRFLMNADSLQGYNSSNKLYFEVSSNGIKYGTDLTNSGTTYTAATTTQVSESNNAANTIVTVYPTTIDYAAGTATLAVKCTRGTTAITPSAWKWTKGTSTTSIGTNSTLQVTDLNAVYNCTVTIAV